MKTRLMLVIVALLIGTACAQQAGQVDMLEWWTTRVPGYYLAPANGGNPLYSVVWPGKFWLVKGSSGYPWDINLYDNNFIYFWITELDWSNSSTYKKFNDGLGTARSDYSFKITPRYLTIPAKPGKIATIEVANSRFEFESSCAMTRATTVGHVVNEVWGPYQEAIPFTDENGIVHSSLRTLVVSYRYNCDSAYSHCKDKEEFHLAHPYGLVQWNHFTLENGIYVQQDKTTHNKLLVGKVVPVFPCF